VLIILQILEQSVIFLKYGVASLVFPKEEGVSVIYPKFLLRENYVNNFLITPTLS
jgi:hypothetical protein